MKKKIIIKKYNNFETILKSNIKIVDTRKRYKMDTLITQIHEFNILLLILIVYSNSL
jgi:hypothetical protein